MRHTLELFSPLYFGITDMAGMEQLEIHSKVRAGNCHRASMIVILIFAGVVLPCTMGQRQGWAYNFVEHSAA